jgi:hypothetical protein
MWAKAQKAIFLFNPGFKAGVKKYEFIPDFSPDIINDN